MVAAARHGDSRRGALRPDRLGAVRLRTHVHGLRGARRAGQRAAAGCGGDGVRGGPASALPVTCGRQREHSRVQQP